MSYTRQDINRRTSMNHLVMHIDGSGIHKGKSLVFGCGIVAHHDGVEVDVHRAIAVPKKLDGFHEMAAFVEAVLYAKAIGFAAEQVTVYTDDQAVGYANGSLHPGNYNMVRAEALRTRLRLLTNLLYDDEVYETALYFLQHANILKVKSHCFLVYQERAHYLAFECARHTASGTSGQPLPYESWLQRGLSYYISPAEPQQIWFAPFVAPLATAA
jgi:hypothetical protein